MMDGAYFVGRKELLDFFNDLLDVEYQKIEQTASGAMACQITNIIFPGSVPMSRVNWDAKADFEFVQNYKLLQNAFNKHKVQRYVDVDKLIRAKYQDNLEFCQWLKAFFEQSGASRSEDYDPAAVRAKGKGGKAFNEKFGRQPVRRVAASSSSSGRMTTTARAAPAARPTAAATKVVAGDASRPSRPLRDRENQDNQINAAEMEALKSKNQEMSSRVADLEQSLLLLEEERDAAILEVEKERDFYFTKLRDVEVLLQIYQEQNPDSPAEVFDEIFKVLYATMEEEVEVTDEGKVITKAAAALDSTLDNDLEA